MSTPDVLYIVRPGEDNEELRYSLRSIAANLAHGQVWIAGHRPAWVNPATTRHIPVAAIEPPTFREKAAVYYGNARNNLAAGLAYHEVSETVLLFNDDFFVVEPVETVPVLHYGSMETFAAALRLRNGPPSQYVLDELATGEWLELHGVGWPRSYALHVPLPVRRRVGLEVLSVLPAGLHFRTAYGNLDALGGTATADVKVSKSKTAIAPGPFWSTDDRSFRAMPIGARLRAMFPEPGPYEIV